jgi:hypothetical protein
MAAEIGARRYAHEPAKHQLEHGLLAEAVGNDLEAELPLHKETFGKIRNGYDVCGSRIISASPRQRNRSTEGGQVDRTMGGKPKLVARACLQRGSMSSLGLPFVQCDTLRFDGPAVSPTAEHSRQASNYIDDIHLYNLRYSVNATNPGQRRTVETHGRKSYRMEGTSSKPHRVIKRRVRPMLGFQSAVTARMILGGIEMVHMMRKQQAKYASNRQPSLAEQFDLLAA